MTSRAVCFLFFNVAVATAPINKESLEVAAAGVLPLDEQQSLSDQPAAVEVKHAAALLRSERLADPLDDIIQPAASTTARGSLKRPRVSSEEVAKTLTTTQAASISTTTTIVAATKGSRDDIIKVGLMLLLYIIFPVLLISLCIQDTGFKQAATTAAEGDATTGDEGDATQSAEGDATETQPADGDVLAADGQEALKVGKASVVTAFWAVQEETRQRSFFEILYKEKGGAAVTAICEDPGIYAIMWATRKVTWDQVLILILAVALQIFLPLFLFSLVGAEKKLFDMPAETTMWAKQVWPLIFVYTLSTIKGTVVRVSGMCLLRRAVPGWGSVLVFGAAVLIVSSMLTLTATRVLFYDNPAVKDMLLNACAVNFIPDMDKSLLTLLGTANNRAVKDFQLAQQRLTALAEAWPESDERQKFHDWFDLPTGEALKERPMIFFVAFVDLVATTACLLIVSFVVFRAGGDIVEYFVS